MSHLVYVRHLGPDQAIELMESTGHEIRVLRTLTAIQALGIAEQLIEAARRNLRHTEGQDAADKR